MTQQSLQTDTNSLLKIYQEHYVMADSQILVMEGHLIVVLQAIQKIYSRQIKLLYK